MGDALDLGCDPHVRKKFSMLPCPCPSAFLVPVAQFDQLNSTIFQMIKLNPIHALRQQSSLSEVYEQHSNTLKSCHNNCRLAMIAIAAFVAQELVEKKEIVYQVGLKGAADSAPPQ